MTRQQLRIFTASLLLAFISLHTAASMRGLRGEVNDLDSEAGGLEDEVSELRAKVEELEEEIERSRWER